MIKMKKITREELLKLQKENEELVLFNEYYTRNGNSTIKKGMQILKRYALRSVSRNNDEFYKVEGGYATPYIYENVFKGE